MNFVLDLDGTICFGGNPVSEPIVRALENIQEAVHRVIFASARPIRDMFPVLDKSLHHYTLIKETTDEIDARRLLRFKVAVAVNLYQSVTARLLRTLKFQDGFHQLSV